MYTVRGLTPFTVAHHAYFATQARVPNCQSAYLLCLTDARQVPDPASRTFQPPPQLKPESEAEYKQVHAAVWPGVLAAIERAHTVDYSIHYYSPLHLLIANFKYVGNDYEKDMKSVADDPDTQRWWKLTDGMQESFVEGATGSGKDIPWWQV